MQQLLLFQCEPKYPTVHLANVDLLVQQDVSLG